MTVTDWIREHALAWVGVHDSVRRQPSLDELRRTEWDPFFERLMRSRLIIGGMRYLRFGNPKKGFPYRENIPGFRKKIELYFETGNAEYLVDIANYAMVLFRYPEHPEHHFEVTDHDDALHMFE